MPDDTAVSAAATTSPSFDYDGVAVCRALVEDMEGSMTPSVEFDVRIDYFLSKQPLPDGANDWEKLGFLMEVKPYTSDQDVAMELIRPGWWWHMSHLETEVVPTYPEPDIPMSSSTDYRFNGRPLGYSCMTHGNRQALALSICVAVLRAKLGLMLKAKAKQEGRQYLVQTGHGPMIANKEGKLLEMPAGAWLSEEGELIAHRDAFPQYHFLEPDALEDDEGEGEPEGKLEA